MKQVGITVFGCEEDEANLFSGLAPRFGMIPTFTSEPVSPCNASLAQGNTLVSVSHKSPVSEATLAALKRRGVKYISTRSIGCDHINMVAAKKLGIAVGTVTYSPDGVADYTLLLMLMAIRHAKQTMAGVENFDFRLSTIRGKELRNMTVGIVGAGHIGQAVTERLQGFGCRILTYNRTPKANCVPLEELLKRSDIVTLHVPLCKETHHMIGQKEMASMKQGAILVNTGRGALVDTDALVKSLEANKLGGAALDVLEGEEGIFYFDCSHKQIDNRFLLLQKMPNVIISPHTAYYTGQVLQDTIERTILNCLNFERSQNHV